MGLFQIITDYLKPSHMDADTSLTANSDNVLPTQKAVKTYISSSTGPMAKLYKNGILKTSPKVYITSGIVVDGTVSFNLTDDGTVNGNPIFTNVYKESLNWWVDDSTNQYQLGNYLISQNNKLLTLSVNKLGSVIIGIIQFVSGADGVTINVTVWGD